MDGLTPREIINKGISMSFIPEDRLGMGLVGSMSITDNMLLKTYGDQKGFILRRKPARALAEKLVEKLQISTPSINIAVQKLSGGNVQKVLLGREIDLKPQGADYRLSRAWTGHRAAAIPFMSFCRSRSARAWAFCTSART